MRLAWVRYFALFNVVACAPSAGGDSDMAGRLGGEGGADAGIGGARNGARAGTGGGVTDPSSSPGNLGDFSSGGSGAGDAGLEGLLEQACASESAGAEALPAVIQLVVDISGSMGNTAPGSTLSKWQVTRDALDVAIDAIPESTAVGVVYYPNMETTAGGPCFLEEVSVPIDRLGTLGSMQRTAIEQSFTSVMVEGGTPTHDAYQFSLAELETTPLPGPRFVILITDGTPTFSLGCVGTGLVSDPVDSGPLITEAQNAATRGVRTFVIGSPGSEGAREALSQMASVGQTGRPGCSNTGPNYCHFDMTTQPDFAAALGNALAEIRGAAVSCTYSLPSPPSGEELDPDKVNLIFREGDSGIPQEILRDDPSDDDCTEGWQYSADQTQILLCGDTCDIVQSVPDAQIDLIFGCETKIDVR